MSYVARVAGKATEAGVNMVGHAVKHSPNVVKNHKVASGALAAYAVGYKARGVHERDLARTQEMNQLMTHTTVKYRAQDKHPASTGGTY